MTIQTTSTKCQYRPASSTFSDFSGPQPPLDREHHQREQIDHADENVRAVEAGERVEGGAEQVGAERQPALPEVVNSYTWKPRKMEPRRRSSQPDDGALPVVALHRRERQHHGQRAHQQDEGAEEVSGMSRIPGAVCRRPAPCRGVGPGEAVPLVRHVGGDQAPKRTHSDPMKVQNAIFRLSRPVEVSM
jgi:hypothetical protein